MILQEDIELLFPEQQYKSSNTSINSNKLPAIFSMVTFKPNTINLDYGGGKFDNATDFLKDKGVTNLIYDPYNRSDEHNKKVIDIITKNGGADSVTCSNVLNVIKEPEVRLSVLNNIKQLVKPEGCVYITVYEGKIGSGERPTSCGYQLNRKTQDYMQEIRKVFPNAIRKGKLIMIKGNLKEARYSDGIPQEKRGWWYFTLHGVQPGSIPRGVSVLEIRDGQNRKGTWGTFVKLNDILNTDELEYYDLIELSPESVDYNNLSITEQIKIFNTLKNRGLTRSELKERLSYKTEPKYDKYIPEGFGKDTEKDSEDGFDWDEFCFELWEDPNHTEIYENFNYSRNKKKLYEGKYFDPSTEIKKLIRELLDKNNIKGQLGGYYADEGGYLFEPSLYFSSNEWTQLKDKLYDMGLIVTSEKVRRNYDGRLDVSSCYLKPDGMRPFDYLQYQKNGLEPITPSHRPKIQSPQKTSTTKPEPTEFSDIQTIQELLVLSGLMNTLDNVKRDWSVPNRYYFHPIKTLLNNEEVEKLKQDLKNLGFKAGGLGKKRQYNYRRYFSVVYITPIGTKPTKVLQHLKSFNQIGGSGTPSVDIFNYYPDSTVLYKIKDYMDRNARVNVGAIKSFDKLYTYYYAAHLLNFKALKDSILNKSNLNYDPNILIAIDNEPTI